MVCKHGVYRIIAENDRPGFLVIRQPQFLGTSRFSPGFDEFLIGQRHATDQAAEPCRSCTRGRVMWVGDRGGRGRCQLHRPACEQLSRSPGVWNFIACGFPGARVDGELLVVRFPPPSIFSLFVHRLAIRCSAWHDDLLRLLWLRPARFQAIRSIIRHLAEMSSIVLSVEQLAVAAGRKPKRSKSPA
jgi:hypothetical protein